MLKVYHIISLIATTIIRQKSATCGRCWAGYCWSNIKRMRRSTNLENNIKWMRSPTSHYLYVNIWPVQHGFRQTQWLVSNVEFAENNESMAFFIHRSWRYKYRIALRFEGRIENKVLRTWEKELKEYTVEDFSVLINLRIYKLFLKDAPWFINDIFWNNRLSKKTNVNWRCLYYIFFLKYYWEKFINIFSKVSGVVVNVQ